MLRLISRHFGFRGVRLALFASALSLAACGAGSGGPSGATSTSGSLAEKYADYFPIGTAINGWHLDNSVAVIERDFNHLTAENAMKAGVIHPAEDTYDWTEADRIADFARSHGMKLTGHALLWHRQAPDWMFEGIQAGDPESLERLKSRLKSHIETVVARYADVVDNWDVVNEAISSRSGKVYRDGSEQSQWYELFGSEEYIYWAYKYARDSLEAIEPGRSVGKLYYNDFSVTGRVDKILTLLAAVEARGIHIDGVGFQSHENMFWASPADLQGAFDRFTAAGYKLKVSELDVTVYTDYATGSFVASPQVEYTPELESAQAARFAELFAVYRTNRADITSVSLWGIADPQSWLNYQPVVGRNDYPLLYKDERTPKAARAEVMDF